MNITVFLGSSSGTKELREEAARLGAWIAQKKHHLIYGGSSTGLMGILARSAMEGGAAVTGVEIAFLTQQRQSQCSLTELIVSETMSERKKLMLERGDIFLAFPGGTGTLEEIAEAISHTRLGLQKGICVFYNLNGYYDPMAAMLDKMTGYGLLDADGRESIRFVSSIEELDKICTRADS